MTLVSVAAFVFILGTIANGALGDWNTVYQTDFSTNPGWTTNEPSRYYWNSASQDYTIKQIVLSTGGYYGVHDTVFDPGSFRFKYDLSVSSADWAGGVNFGMWGDDYESADHGSFVLLMFTHADEGYVTRMETSNSANVIQGITGAGAFSLGTWYHVEVEYNSLSQTLSADIKDKGTGQPFTSMALSNVGPFSSDMTWIGSSNYRSGTNLPKYVGAEGIGTIDNVVLQTPEPAPVPEPVSLASGAIGLACVGACLRRRRQKEARPA
jgi:hypothetical protein